MPVVGCGAARLCVHHRRLYRRRVCGFAAIYGVFVTGLNFFMGYAGQASFGQNAFAAIGGYGSAMLTANYGWEPLAALCSAMFLGALACARRRLSDAAAARPLSRDGDVRARPDHLRDSIEWGA